MKNFALVTLSIAITLGICEIFLRYQPFVTLNYHQHPELLNPEARLSYLTHHRTLHHPDVQIADWGRDCGSEGSSEGSIFRVLFLGDSWMESMDGIPRGFADELFSRNQTLSCLHVVNGAVSSYGASLYLLKGESLLANEDFDMIVISVDETDLMDESLRYKKTTLRGPDGQITRVVPNIVDLTMWYERAILQHQPVYILRLLEAIYYEHVYLPRFREEYYGTSKPIGDYSRIMSIQLSDDPLSTHAEHIDYFRLVLREMLERFSERVGASKVLIAQHPHFLSLSAVPAEERYNDVLASILRQEARRSGVQYYNAFPAVDALPREVALKQFKWPEDPFSHLTTEGYQRYGAQIAAHLDNTTDIRISP